ncbi:MAG: DUF4129 domain-containing protein [bacterium]
MSNNLRKYILLIFSFCAFIFTNAQATDSLAVDDSVLYDREFSDIKDTYTGSEFIYERTVETSGWWSRFKKWLSELFNWRVGQETNDLIDLGFWIGAIIIFLLVVFFLFKAIINKDGRWVFGKKNNQSIIPVTDIESNIHQTNFSSLIKEAEANNNFRLAVRYYYLWLLKKLSTANIIEYDVEKTNSDYAYEIKNGPIKEQFSYTSYLYNYIWYGEFQVDQSQFNKAKQAFNQFIKSLK